MPGFPGPDESKNGEKKKKLTNKSPPKNIVLKKETESALTSMHKALLKHWACMGFSYLLF